MTPLQHYHLVLIVHILLCILCNRMLVYALCTQKCVDNLPQNSCSLTAEQLYHLLILVPISLIELGTGREMRRKYWYSLDIIYLYSNLLSSHLVKHSLKKQPLLLKAAHSINTTHQRTRIRLGSPTHN